MSIIETAHNVSDAVSKYGIMDMPDLEYTPELARETARVYERVSTVVPPVEWPAGQVHRQTSWLQSLTLPPWEGFKFLPYF